MNNIPPKSIVQIHYHNSGSGVARVINKYAEIFNRVSFGTIRKNILVCCSTSQRKSPGNSIEIRHIDACNYHTFRSKKSFDRMKDTLIQTLQVLIGKLPAPVYCIGHNLSLGKNIALSAAFSELSQHQEERNVVRFFSVIHDLAEEGRVPLLAQIRYLESLSVPVWNYLYPQKNVHYIVLNKRNHDLFARAGFTAALLPNPLDAVPDSVKLSEEAYRAVTAGLVKLSRNEKTGFDPSAETFFYPVRVISRKNVLEAVIVACLLHKGNLLIGGYGTSAPDRALFNGIKRLAQHYHLSVILDVERLTNHLPKKYRKSESIFSLLYRYTDTCISTSVSEGFGYALFEPWLFGKAVVGRLPQGIASDEWCDFSHLYSRFEIPVSWISFNDLVCWYRAGVHRAFGATEKNVSVGRLQEMLVKERRVDFGVLNNELQFEIVKSLLVSVKEGRKNAKVFKLNQWYNRYVPPRGMVDKNRRKMLKKLTGEAYDTLFRRCFYQKRKTGKENTCDRYFFSRYFSSPEKFRLLMTPVIKKVKIKNNFLLDFPT